MIKSRLLTVCLSVGLAIAAAGTARAQDFQPVQATQDWLNSTATQGTIKPGTVITTQNWTQYQQFMPLGMQRLFSGQYFWKIPPDVAMTVGPTKVLPLPKTYMEASEKYGSQTSIGSTPSGHHFVANYVAGQPFPNPQEPNKGYKILANVWFSYVPNLYAQPLDHPGVSCTVDRFGSMSCSRIQWIYRQTGYNTDPDVQQNLPQAGDVWFTEWFMVLQPEQSKYTTNLTLFHKNPEKYEDDYVFVPALRRSLRLAVSARCAPAGGSDFVLDDYKTVGFNGGLALFDAKFLGHRKIVALLDDYSMQTGTLPDDWDMPLGWAKPSWGNWQLRDVDVIDVRRIPAESAGYCYGSRVMYVDSGFNYADWIDVYDSNLQLWKMFWLAPRAADVPGVGHVTTNSVTAAVWDVQNDHATLLSTVDDKGVGPYFNSNAPADYHNFNKYSSPGGLMSIMR